MDVNDELRKTEKTGKLVLGSKETLDATESGDSELTILSGTCAKEVERNILNQARENEVPIYYYPNGSAELGLALGKPFLVSAMAVIEPGDSIILELGEIPDEG